MMIRWVLAALVLALCPAASATAQDTSGAATVKTRSGEVRGTVEDGILAFKGIP